MQPRHVIRCGICSLFISSCCNACVTKMVTVLNGQKHAILWLHYINNMSQVMLLRTIVIRPPELFRLMSKQVWKFDYRKCMMQIRLVARNASSKRVVITWLLTNCQVALNISYSVMGLSHMLWCLMDDGRMNRYQKTNQEHLRRRRHSSDYR